MAATGARGMLDLVLRQHTLLCFRSPLHLRQLVTTSSPWNAPVAPPKRPPSAFLIFYQSQKENIVRNNPGINAKETVKIAANLWKQLDMNDKDNKLQEARERFAEYKRQYDLYTQTLTPTQKSDLQESRKLRRENRVKRRKKTELKKLGKPKMPRNAFSLFVKSSKLERGDAPPSTFLKGLVEYWKQMPEQEKDIYVEDARLDRERYEKEMKVWEQKMKDIGREDVVRRKNRTRVKKSRSPKSPAKKSAVKKSTTKRKPRRKSVGKSKLKSVSTQTD